MSHHETHPALRRHPARLAVPAVMVVAGLLFAASAGAADSGDLREDPERLSDLIRSEAASVDGRGERVADLRAEVDALTGVVGDGAVQQLQDAASALAPGAGLDPVDGPGVVVTLDDAPRDKPVPEDVDADLLVVHQQDVEGVVNALWAGGAEAMMLMDQRVISTSAVRCVGSTLRLQGRVYSPPYTITAIGDPERLQDALDDSGAVSIYQEYVEAFGLGYAERREADVALPAFEGPLELQYAEALPVGSS